MSEKIFLIDDDINFLNAIERQFKTRFNLLTTEDPKQALEHSFKEDPIAVVVSDMRMPGMSGIELIAKIKELSPQSVCILLTGFADQEVAINAINQGSIFRFFTKPCPNQILEDGISEGLIEYKRIISEQELPDATLKGAIDALTNIIALADPESAERSNKVRGWANQILPHLALKNSMGLKISSMLYPLGLLSISPELKEKVQKGTELRSDEKKALNKSLSVARDLVFKIPRLKAVSKIIYLLYFGNDGSGPPFDLTKKLKVPSEAHILKILIDLEAITSGPTPNQENYASLKIRQNIYDSKTLEIVRKNLFSNKPHIEETNERLNKSPISETRSLDQIDQTKEKKKSEVFFSRQARSTSDSKIVVDSKAELDQGFSTVIGGSTGKKNKKKRFTIPKSHLKENRILRWLIKNRILRLIRNWISVVFLTIIVGTLGFYFTSENRKTYPELETDILWAKNQVIQLISQKKLRLREFEQHPEKISFEVLIEDAGQISKISAFPLILRVKFIKELCPPKSPITKRLRDNGYTIWIELYGSKKGLREKTKKLTGGTCPK